jgi:mRNA interferase RelE/StbE
MTFSVIYTARARRDLKKLPRDVARRCVQAISGIKEDPFSAVHRIEGFRNEPLFSFRIGEYRAILSIEGDRLIIFFLEIGHRSTIYRKY